MCGWEGIRGIVLVILWPGWLPVALAPSPPECPSLQGAVKANSLSIQQSNETHRKSGNETMASIIYDKKTKTRSIQFRDGSGKRPMIRLGKVSNKTAETILRHVEALNHAKIANTTPDVETSRWLQGIESSLAEKLSRVGLIDTRPRATLKGLVDGYLAGRTDVKSVTIVNLKLAALNLTDYFGETKPLTAITPADAEEYRRELRSRLSENTTRRRCGRARQFFRFAVRKGLVASNPFGDMKGVAVKANKERMYFVTAETAGKVLEACPDQEWRVLFVLCRIAGLRCTSETHALTWDDIDWNGNRMIVRSPKTEAYEGKDKRVIPLFPEVRDELLKLFESSRRDPVYVITRGRRGDGKVDANLRTTFRKIVVRAGVAPWPKLMQNLRASRATELAATHPSHLSAAWLGHSEKIADEHYRQVLDSDFARAASQRTMPSGQLNTTDPLQNPLRQTSTDGNNNRPKEIAHLKKVGDCSLLSTVEKVRMTPRGLEPRLPP